MSVSMGGKMAFLIFLLACLILSAFAGAYVSISIGKAVSFGLGAIALGIIAGAILIVDEIKASTKKIITAINKE